MIALVRGAVASWRGASTVVVDTGGVGYEVVLHDRDRAVVRSRESVELAVRMVVTEDAHTLYGFIDPAEVDVFGDLIAVRGLGPGTAMRVLSVLDASRLRAPEPAELRAIPGIGAKLAAKIVEALR